MVHLRRTSDEKRPGRGRQRINPREFATTGPRTPETAANYLLHRGLRQDGSGDQRGVSTFSERKGVWPRGRIGNGKPETSGPVSAASGDHCREHLPRRSMPSCGGSMPTSWDRSGRRKSSTSRTDTARCRSPLRRSPAPVPACTKIGRGATRRLHGHGVRFAAISKRPPGKTPSTRSR